MGFLISKEFPSRFLKGDEVGDKELDLNIREIKREKVYSRQTNKDDLVLVVYFDGKDRGVIIKKERANDIKAIYGDDTDNWKGKPVRLYTVKKKVRDGIVDVIRFKVPPSLSKELDNASTN